MHCTATARSAAIFALIFSLGLNLHAQTGPPVFRSPADAGRTSRYRNNLIRYNEAWAVRTVHMLFGAEATYQATAGNGSYGTLEELMKQNLISQVLADGHRY